MWNFSSATDTAKYLEALNSNVAVVGVRMTIDYSIGLKFVLTNGDIVGNPQFNFQATNGTVFNVGSCFVDTCTIDTRIDAPGVAGMTTASLVTLEMGYGLVNDEIMYVPIGKYTFQERTSSKKSGKYTLKLQSFSSSLDKKMFKSISGSKTVYDWLKYLCANLTIRYMNNPETDLYFYLSDKMTETYMNSLPNHLKLFKVKKNHKYSTWREFVKDLASVSGCFCTFDESGGLLFTQFRMKSPVKQIDYLSTMSVAENLVKFAVDEVRYSTTNKDGEDVDYGYPVDYTSDYYIDMSSNGLLGNISNPADITDICSEIYSGLGAVKNSATAYVATPFDIKLNRMDFRLQLGDWIAFKSEKGQINYSSGQLMKISYTSPGNANLFSYQSPSPNDNSSSPTSSSTSGGGGGSNELSIVKYINTEEFKLSTLESKIAQMYFTLPANVSPLFSFVMITKNELAGLVSMRLLYDNVDMILKPKFQCSLGYHTLTFTKSFDASEADMLHSVSVYATFVEDSGQNVEYTIPCFVGVHDIEANIMGWKASTGKPDWTGRYEVTDSVKLITFDNVINILGFTYNINVEE